MSCRGVVLVVSHWAGGLLQVDVYGGCCCSGLVTHGTQFVVSVNKQCGSTHSLGPKHQQQQQQPDHAALIKLLLLHPLCCV